MHLMGSNHMGPLLSSLFLCFLFLPENSVAWSIWLIYLTHTLSLSAVCVIPRWVGRTSVCFHTYWFLCCQLSSLISICFAIVHHTCLFSSDNPLVLKWTQYRLSAFCVSTIRQTSSSRGSKCWNWGYSRSRLCLRIASKLITECVHVSIGVMGVEEVRSGSVRKKS